ncbi:Hypothetical predicted protein [Cloeon dipterum]|uniref:cystathionine gamma-lyase n=1 Tax=Cloeon dipterum TaxID=197152 RepID=A0A8S1DJ68_9INSE|nr:Hypothetical predicted protein [Cloeon dipterum]
MLMRFVWNLIRYIRQPLFCWKHHPQLSLKFWFTFNKGITMAEIGFLKQEPGYATKAIHEGQEPSQWNSRAIVPPITLATTFEQDAPAKHRGYEYGRSGNPSRNVLEKCLAALDGAKHGLCFSSGLGATTGLVHLLSSGDHLLSVDDVYGGTGRYFRQCATKFGIQVDFVDATKLELLEKAIKPNTKMVWIESPTNPLMKVIDIKAVSDICKQHPDIILVVDNTFLTSYFQRPLSLGADVVIYSLTKYMNGHADVIMGAVTTSNDQLHDRLRFIQNAAGIVPSPFDCYMVNRSLKTLELRMRQHMTNGLAVARALEAHPQVEKVLHPALPSHPQHKIAKNQCYGHSAIFSFYIKGGIEHSNAFLKNLKLFYLAESLGGFESLAELPCVMTHASVPEEARKELGISDTLVRLSVGLENPEDLVADVKQALDVVAAMK